MSSRLLTVAVMSAALLAGCAKPPDEAPAPPSPTGDAPAPTVPPAGPGPGNETPADVPPGDAPTAPAQPAPDAPPPSDPSAAPKPTSDEPALDTMKMARASSTKIGVPVDLRYQIEGDGSAGQPVQLHLAAVPRVDGANLEISVQRAAGLELTEGTLNVQKATAAGVYRKQVGVQRAASGPRDVQVLVTMGVGEGSAFGFFTVPLESGNISQKADSAKER
jgi:hypothetical protein